MWPKPSGNRPASAEIKSRSSMPSVRSMDIQGSPSSKVTVPPNGETCPCNLYPNIMVALEPHSVMAADELMSCKNQRPALWSLVCPRGLQHCGTPGPGAKQLCKREVAKTGEGVFKGGLRRIHDFDTHPNSRVQKLWNPFWMVKGRNQSGNANARRVFETRVPVAFYWSGSPPQQGP